MTYEGGPPSLPFPRNRTLAEIEVSSIVHNWNHQKFEYVHIESLTIDIGT